VQLVFKTFYAKHMSIAISMRFLALCESNVTASSYINRSYIFNSSMNPLKNHWVNLGGVE